MSDRYAKLLSPLRVGGKLLKNRIITGPSTLHSASNGEQYPTEEAIAHFAGRAKAGAALVTCAGVSFVPTEDDGMHASWDVYKPNSLNSLAHLAERIHYHGALASMELGGGGMTGGGYAVSDGALLINMEPGREMPVEEIKRLVGCYGDAAAALKDANYDGVFLHFGHGLQVGQFLSPFTNKRTDQYGGSLENRARYAIEIIDEIRRRVGRDMIIEVRISGTEIEKGGIEIEEAIAFTEMIQEKIDLIHVSCGMHNPKYMTVTHPCGYLPPIPNVYLADAFKKSGKITIPVVTIGGIQDLDEAEGILADGRADVLCVVRGVIADTDLVNKAYDEKGEDVVPCIKCMRCHDSTVFGHKFLCAVNPVIGMEHELPSLITPAAEKKKVAVVGGGPAGMKAALSASERGHEVTLYESKETLGGTLHFADHVPFKYPLKNFKDYLIAQIGKSDVKVITGEEVSKDTLLAENYDHVILALGADPVIPPIEGIEDNRIIGSLDLYEKEEEIGKSVIIIGGGEAGCDTALYLAQKGKEVTIIEMKDELAQEGSMTHRTELLLELEGEKGISSVTSAVCTEVKKGAVSYRSADGTITTIEANSIVLAAGLRAKTTAVDALQGSAPKVSAIGDCVKARTVENAVKEAFYTALNI